MGNSPLQRIIAMDYFCSWSGGRDSCLALHRAAARWGPPRRLFTVLSEDDVHSRSHGIPRHLLAAQAAALGVSMAFGSATWEDYEAAFVDCLQQLSAEGLTAGGARPVKVLPMRSAHRSDVATEILEAGALVVGSPTINNQIFPTMADVLCYLEGLKPKNLVGAAFGSYGWSGEAVGKLEEWLQRMGVRLVAEGVKVRYVPDAEALAQCRALGETVGQELRKARGDE